MRRDLVLVAVLAAVALGEGLLRSDVAWRPVALLAMVPVLLALPWRRTRPLEMVGLGFGTGIALSLLTVAGGPSTPVGLYSMTGLLVLPYALVRWASGRHVIGGVTVMLVALVVGVASDWTGIGDAIGGAVVLTLPAAFGGTVRALATVRSRELDQVRLREREQLARELHDTVAHHVSAIVIRAQAGRVVAAQHPEAAVQALGVIEAEATLTLSEMRAMVGALREGEEAELAPRHGLADLELLARDTGGQPRVEFERTGPLDDLGPAAGAAVYRIAQESITNAIRHARRATRVDVRVCGDDAWVRLTVCDDGEPTHRAPTGYGLVGMAERAALLGGTLDAGPNADRGWTVSATLPKAGPPR